MMQSLSQARDHLAGRVVGADVGFDSVGKDSRADCSGQLFVALRGDRFDGHDFIAQARAQGAAAALVDHPVDVDIPQLVVNDTRLALGRLAAAWRQAFAGRVVAVTGSNGKTTCKEMIAAILGEIGSVRATAGNLNNDIGMPLTLLEARDEDFLVLEMGANRAGEIAYLSDIGRPQIAVITNAGRAHLEGFGSLEGVAHAKGEIATGLPSTGTLVIPADSDWTELWRHLAAGRSVVTCGLDDRADLQARADRIETLWGQDGFHTSFTVSWPEGELQLRLPLAGLHNVRNALLAVAVALALGIEAEPIRSALAKLTPVAGRLSPRTGHNGVRLIDDTYNANPDSVRAAIEVLTALPGRRWMVLGDLAELGPEAAELHRGLGETARSAGINRLYTVGALSVQAAKAFGSGAKHFSEQADLIADLRAYLGPDDLVLVKGSRLAAMERVVSALCEGAST